MAEIRVQQAHSLSSDQARARLKSFDALLGKYGIQPSWSGERASISAVAVKGHIALLPGQVEVVLKLGRMAKMVGVDPQRLESSIRRRLEESLSAES